MRRHAFVAAILVASFITEAHAASARFSAMDNTVIRVYFTSRPVVWSGVPPQYARSYGLGKALPTGLSIYPLPRDLLAKLPPRSGFDYVRVGPDVALVDKTTHVVVDLVPNVFD